MKEPLYAEDFAGYYTDNDKTKPLKTDAVVTKGDIDYSDQYFEKDQQVVTHVSFPLEGPLAVLYNTNFRLYVPAMNNLNSEMRGIQFKHGHFNVDCFVEFRWDTLKSTSDTPGTSSELTVEPATVNVRAGETQQLNASVNEEGYSIRYKANMPEIATVSDTGLITGEKEGTGSIAVIATKDGAKTLSKTVIVLVAKAGGSSGGGGSDSSFFLKDGNYLVDVALWQEVSDKVSMGDAAFEKNRKALVTVANGKITNVEIATNPVDVGEYHSAITGIESDQTTFQTEEKESMTTKPENKQYQYLKRLSFTMPEQAQPSTASEPTYVPVTFTVPDTPMDAIYPDGIRARLKFDWSTAEKTNKQNLKADSSSAAGTTTGGSSAGSSAKPVELTDKATGIKVSGNTDTLNSKAALVVTPVTDEAKVAAAKKAAGTDAEDAQLYQIQTTVNGKETAPACQGTVAIPCDSDKATVYRVDADGNAVKIGGSLKDGAYVFGTNQLGDFLLVKDGETPSENPDQPGQPDTHENCPSAPFADVDISQWYHEGIDYAIEKGMMNGVASDAFAPNDTTTRAMIVTILYRLEGKPEAEAASFKDVEAGSWYEAAVNWAAANGIVNGYDADTFAPTDEITREQMAAILYRYAGFKGQDVSGQADLGSFTDSSAVSEYAQNAMAWAVDAELINGMTETTLVPQGSATRAQVATLMMRLCENVLK